MGEGTMNLMRNGADTIPRLLQIATGESSPIIDWLERIMVLSMRTYQQPQPDQEGVGS